MAEWRNRIISQRMVDAAELRAHPMNPRRHPQGQKSAVVGLLNEVGIVDSLTVYASEMYGGLTVLDGHLRKDMGGLWPVNVLDVTDEEAALILATFDYSTSLAELDGAALADLLARVEMTPVEDDGVRDLLAQLAAEHVPESVKTDVDAEPQIDKADELRVKWGVETGQLWQLGDHRLICGDCTDAAVVARVMGGERAQLLLTSPPYGVGMEYEGVPKQDDTVDLVERCFAVACPIVSPNGFAFVNFGERYVWDVPMVQVYHSIFKGQGWRWYDQRFWKRSQVGMAIWNTTQPRAMSAVEYLFTFQNGKALYPVHNLAISKEQLWDDDGSSAGMIHPAVMSLGVASKAVEIYSDSGDAVYEPFSGSGTTIIACEQLGRKCRAVEILPAYVAVALQRYADATGQQPTLLEAA